MAYASCVIHENRQCMLVYKIVAVGIAIHNLEQGLMNNRLQNYCFVYTKANAFR